MQCQALTLALTQCTRKATRKNLCTQHNTMLERGTKITYVQQQNENKQNEIIPSALQENLPNELVASILEYSNDLKTENPKLQKYIYKEESKILKIWFKLINLPQKFEKIPIDQLAYVWQVYSNRDQFGYPVSNIIDKLADENKDFDKYIFYSRKTNLDWKKMEESERKELSKIIDFFASYNGEYDEEDEDDEYVKNMNRLTDFFNEVITKYVNLESFRRGDVFGYGNGNGEGNGNSVVYDGSRFTNFIADITSYGSLSEIFPINEYPFKDYFKYSVFNTFTVFLKYDGKIKFKKISDDIYKYRTSDNWFVLVYKDDRKDFLRSVNSGESFPVEIHVGYEFDQSEIYPESFISAIKEEDKKFSRTLYYIVRVDGPDEDW